MYMIGDAFNAVFVLFIPLIYRETYIERRKDESANDRNDRAIRTAARWVVRSYCNKLTSIGEKRAASLRCGGIVIMIYILLGAS